ncbi:uncharacterized protein LOC107018707 [Solanum pennellii]|uniref:Uncharacterized protein LOC107018707 n=1 Tax=Solanum pennellii TaxID=28526 RepID=A0ABM1GR85_SOLPN|nr:uncharacterized protein LOC107018707 [Solanum pennellii]
MLTGSNHTLIQSTKYNLQQKFKMKDLSVLRFFLGLEFSMNASGILLNQRKYALELNADSGQGGAKPASTPLDFNQRHTSYEFDVATGSTTNYKLLIDPDRYQRLVGRLLYLVMTRPDIAYTVQVLSQFMHKPKESHMLAAIRVIRYIKNAPGLSLFMSSTTSHQLFAYCDSDWVLVSQSRKSVTGYMIKVGSSLISWKSKKQETISRSSAEAEFRSMASTVAELSWLTGLFKELGVSIVQPIDLHCDSKVAIQIAANPIFH